MLFSVSFRTPTFGVQQLARFSLSLFVKDLLHRYVAIGTYRAHLLVYETPAGVSRLFELKQMFMLCGVYQSSSAVSFAPIFARFDDFFPPG